MTTSFRQNLSSLSAGRIEWKNSDPFCRRQEIGGRGEELILGIIWQKVPNLENINHLEGMISLKEQEEEVDHIVKL